MKTLLITIVSFYICACSTIEFVNGPKIEETIVREKWHHLGLNGLIEFSKPMDITYHCGKQQWDSVIIEQNVFNGVAAFSTTTPLGIEMYSPWTIVYKCRDPID